MPHTFDKKVASELYIKSPATCMTKAEYYYSCECGEKGTETFIDENGEFLSEVHPYEDVWYNDEQFHYGCNSLTSITIPNSVEVIGSSAFYGCNSLEKVFFKGTTSEWKNIVIDSGNSYLYYAKRYYYSESQPDESGNYWHYVDGEIVIW